MKRLLTTVPEALRYIGIIVLSQLFALVVNIGMIFIIANYVANLLHGEDQFLPLLLAIGCALLLRMLCQKIQTSAAFYSSKRVKEHFRDALFQKIYGFGLAYSHYVKPAELIQIGVEGIEQLDSFYGKFVPQLIYSLLSPLVLFAFLMPINGLVAGILLAFVPLIPLAIMLVQKLAKKVMTAYWGSYINLSDRFLDNIQGLSTLKLYGSDAKRNDEMNKEAEDFRVATMKLLRMQIANIIVMDVVAYGGAGLGTAVALYEMQQGAINIAQTIIFILLVAEFFLPLRLLGSFFHIAMNGMAAADRMFKLLDMEAPEDQAMPLADNGALVSIRKMSYGYDADYLVLKDIDLDVPKHGLISLVGPSGCGKSTLAGVIGGGFTPTKGTLAYGEIFGERKQKDLAKHIAFVDASPWLFAESVATNLRMAAPNATDTTLWQALEMVHLDDFLKSRQGLDTMIEEAGANFSGGQRQRLAIARVLLKKAALYIFDEATSNIDAESEAIIMEVLNTLKQDAAVILITHRLHATLQSDEIVLLDNGGILERGNAESLLCKDGLFKTLYQQQLALEQYGVEGTPQDSGDLPSAQIYQESHSFKQAVQNLKVEVNPVDCQ